MVLSSHNIEMVTAFLSLRGVRLHTTGDITELAGN